MMKWYQLRPTSDALFCSPSKVKLMVIVIGIVMLLHISYMIGRTQQLQKKKCAVSPDRNTILPNKRTNNTNSNPKKVVLLAYYRGGSSMLGELMNQNPEVFYVFEPLRGVHRWLYGNTGVNTTNMYMPEHPFRDVWIGDVHPFEAEGTISAMKAMLTCDVERLPPDYYLDKFRIDRPHKSMQAFRRCFRSQNIILRCDQEYEENCTKYNDYCYKRATNLTACFKTWMCPHRQTKDAFYRHIDCLLDQMHQLAPCLLNYTNSCRNSNIIATKVIRMRMRHARYLLKELPDVKFVHLIRDPRGMFLSQKSLNPELLSNISSIRALCDSMLDDVVERRSLEELYPDSFLQVRYEDMAADPHGTAANVYNHIGVHMPHRVTKWITANTGVKEQEITDSNNTILDINKRDIRGTSKSISAELLELVEYSTYKGNSTATAYSWMRMLSDKDHCAIANIQQCKTLIKLLNYKLPYNSPTCSDILYDS